MGSYPIKEISHRTSSCNVPGGLPLTKTSLMNSNLHMAKVIGMHICMHACVYVRMYVCMYVCIFGVCVYIYI